METTAASPSKEMRRVMKRYEDLLTIRKKAIEGNGAWFWKCFEPILIYTSSDTGTPKGVKLRCCLCDALFSDSNPSRTASEHLLRGTCPNFSPPSASAAAAADQHPQPQPVVSSSSRKRACNPNQIQVPHSSPSTSPILLLPSSSQQPSLVLSGGKDDFSELALFEDSVKKLKSSEASRNYPALPKARTDAALSFLSDWLFEGAGLIRFSSVEHPKFRAFLEQVGLPPIRARDISGTQLDTRYNEAHPDAKARIRDAQFFQVAAYDWVSSYDGDSLISINVNLPNRTTVFCGAVISKVTEEVLWDTVTNVSGGSGGATTLCAGIVSNWLNSTWLRSIEGKHNWMYDLPYRIFDMKKNESLTSSVC